MIATEYVAIGLTQKYADKRVAGGAVAVDHVLIATEQRDPVSGVLIGVVPGQRVAVRAGQADAICESKDVAVLHRDTCTAVEKDSRGGSGADDCVPLAVQADCVRSDDDAAHVVLFEVRVRVQDEGVSTRVRPRSKEKEAAEP